MILALDIVNFDEVFQSDLHNYSAVDIYFVSFPIVNTHTRKIPDFAIHLRENNTIIQKLSNMDTVNLPQDGSSFYNDKRKS